MVLIWQCIQATRSETTKPRWSRIGRMLRKVCLSFHFSICSSVHLCIRLLVCTGLICLLTWWLWISALQYYLAPTTTTIQADVIQYFLIAPKTISSEKCLACRLRRGESQRKQFSEEMIKYLLQSDRSKWKCKCKREKQRSFSQGEMIQGQP